MRKLRYQEDYVFAIIALGGIIGLILPWIGEYLTESHTRWLENWYWAHRLFLGLGIGYFISGIRLVARPRVRAVMYPWGYHFCGSGFTFAWSFLAEEYRQTLARQKTEFHKDEHTLSAITNDNITLEVDGSVWTAVAEIPPIPATPGNPGEPGADLAEAVRRSIFDVEDGQDFVHEAAHAVVEDVVDSANWEMLKENQAFPLRHGGLPRTAVGHLFEEVGRRIRRAGRVIPHETDVNIGPYKITDPQVAMALAEGVIAERDALGMRMRGPAYHQLIEDVARGHATPLTQKEVLDFAGQQEQVRRLPRDAFAGFFTGGMGGRGKPGKGKH